MSITGILRPLLHLPFMYLKSYSYLSGVRDKVLVSIRSEVVQMVGDGCDRAYLWLHAMTLPCYGRYWVELLTLYAALMTDPVKLHRDAVPLSHEFLRKQRIWKPKERTCEVCTLSHTDGTRHHQSSSLQ